MIYDTRVTPTSHKEQMKVNAGGKKKHYIFLQLNSTVRSVTAPVDAGSKKKNLLSVRTESIVFGAVFKVYFFPIFFICPVSIICILIC